MTLPILTVTDWLDRDLPEPDFVMGHWLTTTSRVLLTAETGLGKSNFVMALGMHAAAGEPFLHWEPRRRVKVLYIDGEMARRLLKRRIAEAVNRIGDIPTSFHALSHEDIENGLPPLNTKAGQDCIEKVIAAVGGVDLIIFDSIMCLLVGDMKDGEPWAQVMPWVQSLTKRGIGQIWVHHTGHDVSRGYGDKTKEWQLDTVLHMESVENAATDVSFSLEFRKARERTPETRADFATAKVALIGDEWTSEIGGKRAGHVSPLGLKFLEALRDAATAGDKMQNGRRCATSDQWRQECETRGLIDPAAKPTSARALFYKYRRELIGAERIGCDGDLSWAIA